MKEKGEQNLRIQGHPAAGLSPSLFFLSLLCFSPFLMIVYFFILVWPRHTHPIVFILFPKKKKIQSSESSADNMFLDEMFFLERGWWLFGSAILKRNAVGTWGNDLTFASTPWNQAAATRFFLTGLGFHCHVVAGSVQGQPHHERSARCCFICITLVLMLN